jgi:hypothetical protein
MGRTKIYTNMTPTSTSHPSSQLIEPSEYTKKDTRESIISFGHNATNYRTFTFSPWYGAGIDTITLAMQDQVTRFLAKTDGEFSIGTVVTYCRGGISRFLDFLLSWNKPGSQKITLDCINRELIDNYLLYLRQYKNISRRTQKHLYSQTKSVLIALAHRDIIYLVKSGDYATFPRNPFPNSNRKGQSRGETPFTSRERKSFANALKLEIKPIFENHTKLTSKLLCYALLTIALYTGRNTTPLLEMEIDCIKPHPKPNFVFLVVWKRRSHKADEVILRKEKPVDRATESTSAIRVNIEVLIRRVIALRNLRSTCCAAAASRNLLGTQRYSLKIA